MTQITQQMRSLPLDQRNRIFSLKYQLGSIFGGDLKACEYIKLYKYLIKIGIIQPTEEDNRTRIPILIHLANNAKSILDYISLNSIDELKKIIGFQGLRRGSDISLLNFPLNEAKMVLAHCPNLPPCPHPRPRQRSRPRPSPPPPPPPPPPPQQQQQQQQSTLEANSYQFNPLDTFDYDRDFDYFLMNYQ